MISVLWLTPVVDINTGNGINETFKNFPRYYGRIYIAPSAYETWFITDLYGVWTPFVTNFENSLFKRKTSGLGRKFFILCISFRFILSTIFLMHSVWLFFTFAYSIHFSNCSAEIICFHFSFHDNLLVKHLHFSWQNVPLLDGLSVFSSQLFTSCLALFSAMTLFIWFVGPISPILRSFFTTSTGFVVQEVHFHFHIFFPFYSFLAQSLSFQQTIMCDN
jgi:hypothetical protein